MPYFLSEVRAEEALQHTEPAAAAHDWKTQALSAYQQRRQDDGAALWSALAHQVRELTGRDLAIDAIWIDLDRRVAFVTVDGVRFRWEPSQLVLLRPCVHCGGGEFTSPPLTSAADVGYALGAWQPRHPECQPDDPASWLDADAEARP